MLPLVLLESLACGTPVAAYPVPGPQDVLARQSSSAPVGFMHSDLGQAVQSALAANIPRARCRDYVETHFSWKNSKDQFLQHARPVRPERYVFSGLSAA